MNAKNPSWREVAEALGERMQHHRYCDHPLAEADPDNCPYCADRAAFNLFAAKAGWQETQLDGVAIPLVEVESS